MPKKSFDKEVFFAGIHREKVSLPCSSGRGVTCEGGLCEGVCDHILKSFLELKLSWLPYNVIKREKEYNLR